MVVNIDRWGYHGEMTSRVSRVLVVTYNWIVSITAISLPVLIIFRREPLMQWLWKPVIAGVYVSLLGLVISAVIRFRRSSRH